jgi:hypothetical protein
MNGAEVYTQENVHERPPPLTTPLKKLTINLGGAICSVKSSRNSKKVLLLKRVLPNLLQKKMFPLLKFSPLRGGNGS